MTNAIAKRLKAIFKFGLEEKRVLFVGLDASGRTTALYLLKLGEVVTTIPTIGFNVETIEHDNVSFTVWDVGGCDKIRPLWRHYFQNTSHLVFFVDSNDRERIDECREELHLLLAQDELSDAGLLVFANKQDLPNAMSASEVTSKLGLHSVKSHPWFVQASCAVTGDGLFEGFSWLASPKSLPAHPTETKGDGTKASATEKKEKPVTEEDKMSQLLEEWLEREDEPDDKFISKLENCTLDSWDHYTHLRIAWLYLHQHGRKKGMDCIFEKIKHFIANSDRTKRARGTTFHETMTYFWVHMVHFAMKTTKNPDGEFKTFLLLNPQLANGGMFLHYYSKKLMLNTAESREQVVLPDKRPLPSLITDTAGKPDVDMDKIQQQLRESRMNNSDDDFISDFEAGTLDKWNHESFIRMIYIYLTRLGRKEGKIKILEAMKRIEKDSYHDTINYFWLHMVDLAIAQQYGSSTRNSQVDSSDGSAYLSFPDMTTGAGYGADTLKTLVLDNRHYLKYYSNKLIYCKESQEQFALPDKKSLPTVT